MYMLIVYKIKLYFVRMNKCIFDKLIYLKYKIKIE
nr:MAG TPA: hypothetical protein [Caudoviricetes sp.]